MLHSIKNYEDHANTKNVDALRGKGFFFKCMDVEK